MELVNGWKESWIDNWTGLRPSIIKPGPRHFTKKVSFINGNHTIYSIKNYNLLNFINHIEYKLSSTFHLYPLKSYYFSLNSNNLIFTYKSIQINTNPFSKIHISIQAQHKVRSCTKWLNKVTIFYFVHLMRHTKNLYRIILLWSSVKS